MSNGAATTATETGAGTNQMQIALRSREAAFDALVAERDPAKRNALREQYRFACCWVQELEVRS